MRPMPAPHCQNQQDSGWSRVAVCIRGTWSPCAAKIYTSDIGPWKSTDLHSGRLSVPCSTGLQECYGLTGATWRGEPRVQGYSVLLSSTRYGCLLRVQHGPRGCTGLQRERCQYDILKTVPLVQGYRGLLSSSVFNKMNVGRLGAYSGRSMTG